MYKYRKEKNSKARNILIILLIIILTAILSILLYRMYEEIDIYTYETSYINSVGTKTSQNIEEIKNQGKQVADVVEDVTLCVVGISKIKNAGTTIFIEESAANLGLGTGIIVSENGYILSNEHVTGSKYSNCYITLENGKTYTANVVWSDRSIDLSISKINIKGLPYATLGDSDNVRVGEAVYAIGNPIGFEFQRTVTSGIISAVNRTVKIEEDNKTTYMEDLIQTDATINPGNSGGPLINPDGAVIGINSVKITSAEGIGFAVPINVVKPIIEKYMKEDKFEEAALGIFAYDKNMIQYIDENIDIKNGIYVAQISLDSPAAKSGLKVGDVITKIDNLELNKMCDLRCYIYTKSPGNEVNLTVYRNKKENQINVKLGTK